MSRSEKHSDLLAMQGKLNSIELWALMLAKRVDENGNVQLTKAEIDYIYALSKLKYKWS